MFKKIRAFFTASQPDLVAIAVRNRFRAASDAFDASYAAFETYTTRANHRYNIFVARPVDPHAANTLADVISGYTDRADFEPYTDAYLDAHTSAIENQTAAFDTLTAAFADFNHTDQLYKSAAAVYKPTADLYVFATEAYSKAAFCAKLNAISGNIQAAKDEFEIMQLETMAAKATAADANAANAKATAFKAKAAKDSDAAIRLEQKAVEAQARALALCAKARAVQQIV